MGSFHQSITMEQLFYVILNTTNKLVKCSCLMSWRWCWSLLFTPTFCQSHVKHFLFYFICSKAACCLNKVWLIKAFAENIKLLFLAFLNLVYNTAYAYIIHEYPRYYPLGLSSFHSQRNYFVMNIDGLELYFKHVFKFTQTQSAPVLSMNV